MNVVSHWGAVCNNGTIVHPKGEILCWSHLTWLITLLFKGGGESLSNWQLITLLNFVQNLHKNITDEAPSGVNGGD